MLLGCENASKCLAQCSGNVAFIVFAAVNLSRTTLATARRCTVVEHATARAIFGQCWADINDCKIKHTESRRTPGLG